ncbi:hypothetical protein O7627_36370 [Solwaraspora sp. WMMD1047]|uniref:hypothetical protein n=1 Tax=Solwaraspora sp. WMMD1047 TaxID=3016102 RepID=UPI0024179D8C|nr:hypothetical protein [Solwaraspora sp. WMMD1047]MDG4834745.1 hypothetical protein [Solwaraspora sp. WMMD1047]
MQPCAVCGSVAINTAGYCAQCGTFRGVPGYQQQAGGQPGYGQPPGYAQQPPTGYPSSGGPGYPSSAGPGYPTSGGPGYPTSGAAGYPGSGGYPGAGAPGYAPGAGYPGTPGYPTAFQAPERRRSLLMPLVALGSTLAVLVTAIVVVVVVRSGGDDTTPITGPTTGPTSGPSAEPTSTTADGVDDCLVGEWQVTSHSEEVQNEEMGKLRFTGGEGAGLTLNADGTGRSDYGSGTEFESRWQGRPIVLEIRGSYTYRYRTDDGQVIVSNVDSDAEARVLLDDDQLGQWVEFRPTATTASYTCTGTAMTQKALLYTTNFRRVS